MAKQWEKYVIYGQNKTNAWDKFHTEDHENSYFFWNYGTYVIYTLSYFICNLYIEFWKRMNTF